MRRILAEVLEATQAPPDPGDQRDLPWRKVRCLVKVLSNVPECYPLPGEVKDSTLVIERDALFPWEYEPGSKVILAPDESKSIVQRNVAIPEVDSLRGRTTTYRTDINGDGFTERVVENSFLRVVIGPRFGARIWEVWHKQRNCNLLYQTYEFSGDFIELGGQTDHIREQDNLGEFWKSEFTEKEVVNDENGCRMTYEFKSESTKGLTVVKEIVVPVDQPVVRTRITFKYTGAEQPPADGKPDEFEMTYWPRWGLCIGNEPLRNNVVLVPTETKMHVVRHERTWNIPRYWDLSAPYTVARNEDTGVSAAVLRNQEQVMYSKTYHGHGFYTMEPQMKVVKIPKDGEQAYSQAFVVADAVSADQKGLSLLTIGPEQDGESPVFVLSTQCEPCGANLNCNGTGLPVELMRNDDVDGVPVCLGISWVTPGKLAGQFDSLKTNGDVRALDFGGEL